MAYKSDHFYHMTAADKERMARINDDPNKEWCKLHYQITLKKPSSKQLICIDVYGKDKEDLQLCINEHFENFQKSDKNWKIIKTEDMKLHLS